MPTLENCQPDCRNFSTYKVVELLCYPPESEIKRSIARSRLWNYSQEPLSLAQELETARLAKKNPAFALATQAT